MTPFQNLEQDLRRLPESSNERSLYAPLASFLKTYADDLYKTDLFQAVAEESGSYDDVHIGFPDITMRNADKVVGWIEVKLPKDSLSKPQFYEQFNRYKNSLQNLIITNLVEWQLWQWNEDNKPVLITELTWPASAQPHGSDNVENFLKRFLEGIAFEVRTPKQLAIALARKTQLLSRQVEETLSAVNEDHALQRLRKTFEQTLVDDLTPHQFANMVAETIAYSLFLAKLEHEKRNDNRVFDIHAADRYLPRNVPILKDLYELVLHVANDLPNINHVVQSLVDQLNIADIERIRHKLVEHKAGEDPVIQFYEPFLAEYDPKEREARGVYYTPKPVVDYIVRSVDWILRNKFDKPDGLADPSVNILDPATGTGTFLMSAVQEIFANIKNKNQSLGPEMVSKEFNAIVLHHILEHFYGFELLIAPYAVAHLKLTLELERLGFSFEQAYDDSNPDNDRFKVYLANTLDDPNTPPKSLFGYDAIPKESEQARKIKKDEPVLAIIGNPPYSNFGQINKGEWILNLLKDYKKDLNETKINLDDDFIKFIRFAQWKLEQTGQGIFAMITSNTFLDGITHRQMRKVLMDVYDEIYIYNLHGNSRRGEKAPGGGKDENVFDIQQGVSINFFIKYPHKRDHTVIKICDLWGSRKSKYATLLEGRFDETNWKILDVEAVNKEFSKTRWAKRFNGSLNLFVEKDAQLTIDYGNYWSLIEIFPEFNSGIQTKRDSLTIQYSEDELNKIRSDFIKLSSDEIIIKYRLPADGRDWKVDLAKRDLEQNNPIVTDILYRPFDTRKTFYTGKSKGFLAYPRAEIMRHMFKKNLGMNFTRLNRGASDGYFLACNTIVDLHPLDTAQDSSMLAPLYLYPDTTQQNLLGNSRRPNISVEFISYFSRSTGLQFKDDGRGDLEKTFGPEDIFYYVYAIFNSPTYRLRYSEPLQIDFPRLPVIIDLPTFRRLVSFGVELVNLHLLGNNAFDKSKTLLEQPSQWKISIGGSRPDNIEDWRITEVSYDEAKRRVYVNEGQYFEGVDPEVWDFYIGGYQVLDKWLKGHKKAEHCLSIDDLKHFMKINVVLRETIRIQKEIDAIGFMDNL